MKKFVLTLLFISLFSNGFSQESREARRCRRGQASEYATRDATVLSMMGWGLGIAVGIASLCALVENNPSSSSSSSSSGSSSH